MSVTTSNPYTKLTLVSIEYWDYCTRSYKTRSVFANLPADKDGRVRVSNEWLVLNLNTPARGMTYSVK